jgi:hypothetical protein
MFQVLEQVHVCMQNSWDIADRTAWQSNGHVLAERPHLWVEAAV